MIDHDSAPPPLPAAALPDLLALAVRQAHVAVGVVQRADGVLVDANDAFCRLFGRPREALIGRRSLDLDVWPDLELRQRMLALVERHGSVTGYELPYRTPSGDEGWVRTSALQVRDGGTAYIVGFFSEVTAERELLQGLQQAQARLEVALRATQLLVFRQDTDLRYTWVANPALGSQVSELIGRTDDEILGADAAAPLVAIKRRVLASGQAERHDVWVAHNGQMGCFDLVAEPERDATGRVVAIVCSAQDITRRKQGEPRTPYARGLHQPLRAIQGMTALLAREPLSDRQRERLQRIADDARWLSEQLAPAAGSGPQAPAGAAPGWAMQRLHERHAGTTVLVAEHGAVLRELVAGTLQAAGLRVVEATNGVEAFSLCLQVNPALLLLDMELPQRGAVAAARAVRAMLRARVPIVAMLSADPLLGSAVALDADLDDLLIKPTDSDRLCETVLAWLEAVHPRPGDARHTA